MGYILTCINALFFWYLFIIWDDKTRINHMFRLVLLTFALGNTLAAVLLGIIYFT